MENAEKETGQKRNRSPRLQEVVARSPPVVGDMSVLVRNGGEDPELGVQVFVHRHDGRDIPTTVTVVGSRPHRNDGLLWEVKLIGGQHRPRRATRLDEA